MEALSKFTSDIAFEIMSRTSLKTLDTCKMVSTEWNKIAYESTFMPQHAQRTKTLSGYFLQSYRNSKYSFQFLQVDHPATLSLSGESKVSLDHEKDAMPKDVQILASSKQGILCCCKQDGLAKDHQYYVCKPSTGQWLRIPNPRTRFWTAQVAFVVLGDEPLRYKIIRLSNPRKFARLGSVNFHCEIFDSAEWAWTRLEDLFLSFCLAFKRDTPVQVSGKVYWRLSDDSILGFDVYEENFSRIFLPEAVRDYDFDYERHKGISEYGGRLGFYCKNPQGSLEIWVLRGGYRWDREEGVNLCVESVGKKMDREHVILAGFYNANIVVMETFDDELVFYDFKDGNFRMVKHRGLSVVTDFFPFRSDFEPVDLHGRSTT